MKGEGSAATVMLGLPGFVLLAVSEVGILLAIVHLGTLLPTIRHQVEGVTTFLVDALDDDVLAADRQLDVISGSAGLVVRRSGSPPLTPRRSPKRLATGWSRYRTTRADGPAAQA